MPTCINCEQEFEAKRKDATLCSPKCRMAWSRKKAAEDGDTSVEAPMSDADISAGLPPEALPEKKPSTSHVVVLKEKVKERILAKSPLTTKVLRKVYGQLTADEDQSPPRGKLFWQPKFLPVEHHGTQNDVARQIIAKVPAPKLDPNSEEAELARLQKHQMPVKKRGGES
jgi:hypothetical protein